MALEEATRPPVTVQRVGHVTTITINRPQVRNAVDRRTAQALVDAFKAFDDDPDARVAVLAGQTGTSAQEPISRHLPTGTGIGWKVTETDRWVRAGCVCASR